MEKTVVAVDRAEYRYLETFMEEVYAEHGHEPEESDTEIEDPDDEFRDLDL
jgi:hypothetical protein